MGREGRGEIVHLQHIVFGYLDNVREGNGLGNCLLTADFVTGFGYSVGRVENLQTNCVGNKWF